MATTDKNIIQKTSRDFNSISQDLISSMSNITEEWLPGDETDPGTVYLKVAAMLGDMLSYNRDRGTASMFPETVTERQDAYRLFKSLGYKMKWYRAAQCKMTMSFNQGQGTTATPYIIPRYTVFQTKQTGIKYCYVGEQLSVSVEGSSVMLANNSIDFYAIQGTPVTPPLISQIRVPRVATEKWHSVYGYNVNVSDVSEDVYIKLDVKKVAEGSIVLVDDAGFEWTETRLLSDVEQGRYFELYINNYNGVYVKLATKPADLGVKRFKLFYVMTDGASGRISAASIDSTPLTPIYHVLSTYDYRLATPSDIYNTASIGGYDYETTEEARKEFAKLGMNSNTLITTDDFEKSIKLVDGVDQCKVYDTASHSETVRHYLGEMTQSSSTLSRTINLVSDDQGLINFDAGNCYLWRNSIKIFHHSESGDDTLIFSGVGRTDTTKSPEQHILSRAQIWNGTKYIRPSCEKSYIEITDYGLGIQDFTVHIENEEGDAESYSKGDYWIEYMLDRNPGFVGIDVVPNLTSSLNAQTLSEISENIDAQIADKKHAYITYKQYYKPYTLGWQPKGVINLGESVTRRQSQNMLSTIDLVFKEEFKNKYVEYNTIIPQSELTTSARRVARNSDCTYVNPDYFIPIDVIKGSGTGEYVANVIKCKTSRTKQDNISKRITLINTATPRFDSTTNEWVFELNFGEQIELKPGTVQVAVNYNDVVFSDQPINYDRDNMNGAGVEGGSFHQNIGSLVTSNQFTRTDGNYVLYDSVSDRFIPEHQGTEYRTEGLANIRFALSEDYMTAKTEIPIQISFETTCDLFCEYQGYDPNELYVSPANIRSDF